MRLTTHSDYALRLLMYLAVNNGRLATIPEVAAAYGISTNHLTKVVHRLARAGYVETRRGHAGGMRLARAPDAIGLGEVVRLTEPDLDIAPCFDPANKDCVLRRACRLKHVLERARLAFLETLDAYTLADVTTATGPMRALLGIEPLPHEAIRVHGRTSPG